MTAAVTIDGTELQRGLHPPLVGLSARTGQGYDRDSGRWWAVHREKSPQPRDDKEQKQEMGHALQLLLLQLRLIIAHSVGEWKHLLCSVGPGAEAK